MPRFRVHSRQSLRSRLLSLSGTAFLVYIGIILLFFPLLDFTLDGVMGRTIRSIEAEKQTEATTIARLMVLEFSHLKELLQVEPEVERPIDQRIKQLLWEKVTFNEVIQGIELIHAPANFAGRHLTYWYYRREAPELKPMPGPARGLKKFSGPERELIDHINNQRRVDKTLLESVNRGPKEAGEMLLRYFPIYVPIPDLGAIYWGIAKIGVDAESLRRLLLSQSQDQRQLRNAVWLEIILGLLLSGLITLGLFYRWVRKLTEPLASLSQVAGALQTEPVPELGLWLDNLARVDCREQVEVTALHQGLTRLAQAIQKLGQQLVAAERQTCLGRVSERVIPAVKAQTEVWLARQVQLQEQLQSLSNLIKVYESLPSLTATQQAEMRQVRQQLETPGTRISPRLGWEMAVNLEKLLTQIQDLERLLSPPEPIQEHVSLTPELTRVVNLFSQTLPPGVVLEQEISRLSPVYGNREALTQALLYLVEYAVREVEPEGELHLRAFQASPQSVQISISFSGPPKSARDIQRLLAPFQTVEEFPAVLGPALAAAIIRQHRGELRIQPREGGGLTFLVELPVAPPGDEYAGPGI